jgi:outer membrane protein assembly factor BamD
VRAGGLVLLAVLGLGGCARGFRLRDYPTPDALYAASLAEFQKRKYGNAVEGFEKVTLELGARDPLLPAAYLYLARSYDRRGDHLLAATTYARVTEGFPDDTLADDALYEQGVAYGRLWRRPTLDQQYGILAQATLRTLVSAYPDSPHVEDALKELRRLDEWLATKDLETGLHYKRRGAPDSAIIYLLDVMNLHPETDAARRAGLALLEVYASINYKTDAAELCGKLRLRWPQDGAVQAACPAPPAPGS